MDDRGQPLGPIGGTPCTFTTKARRRRRLNTVSGGDGVTSGAAKGIAILRFGCLSVTNNTISGTVDRRVRLGFVVWRREQALR